MQIERIRVVQSAVPVEPAFVAAWDPQPRRQVEQFVVVIEASEGQVGFGGGADLYGFERYAELFLGTDPRRLAEQSRRAASCAAHGHPCWPVETACHDLAAKAAGIRVADLLGGATDRVPAYASCGTARSPEGWGDVAAARAEEGFTAMKLRLPVDDSDAALSSVASARAAAPDLALMVDLNQAWRMPGDVRPSADPAAVRRLLDGFADHGVVWVEEPLPLHDLSGLRSLRAQAPVRIAGGEVIGSLPEALALLDADGVDVFQADAALTLGLQRCRTLAELCLMRNRWFTPHTWGDELGLVTNLALTCGVGAGPWIEYPFDPPSWTPSARAALLTEPIEPDGAGLLHLPDAPGLGVELDWDRIDGCTVASQEWKR